MKKLLFLLPLLSPFCTSVLEAKSGDCSDNQDVGYFCVPYYQCNQTGFINTDGNDIINPRSSGLSCPDHEEARKSHCPQILDVCCLNIYPAFCTPKPREEPSYGYDYDYYNYEDDYNNPAGKDEDEDVLGAKDGDEVIKDFNKENKCEHFKNQGFACAEYWRCTGKDHSPIISDGSGILSLRSGDVNRLTGCVTLEDNTLDASDQKCPGDNQVCCRNPNYDVKICSPGDEPKKEKENLAECGRTNLDSRRQRKGRIVTVTNLNVTNAAQPGEFPHMCAIYKLEGGSTVYVGGASLISKNQVLSVAHKFYVYGRKKIDERKNIDNFIVRCGEYNMKTDSEIQKTQESGVKEFHFHPQYNPKDKFVKNDLVILQTKQDFIYQEHVGRVCLPRPGDEFDDKDECWSSGWGKDQFGKKGKFSDILKKIDMKIVPRGVCQKRMRKARRFMRRFKLHQSQLCVGGEKGKDTCTGDGGSPHVCIKEGKWIQIGAVAWGIGCGDKLPAIYSNVAPAMCWIDWVMSCHPGTHTHVNQVIQNKSWMMFQQGGSQAPNLIAPSIGYLPPYPSFGVGYLPPSPRPSGRRRDRQSVNQLSFAECGEWAKENSHLTRSCNVIYQNNPAMFQNKEKFNKIISFRDNFRFNSQKRRPRNLHH